MWLEHKLPVAAEAGMSAISAIVIVIGLACTNGENNSSAKVFMLISFFFLFLQVVMSTTLYFLVHASNHLDRSYAWIAISSILGVVQIILLILDSTVGHRVGAGFFVPAFISAIVSIIIQIFRTCKGFQSGFAYDMTE